MYWEIDSRNSSARGLKYSPFKSIIVRGLELVYACDEALRIIAAYEAPDEPSAKLQPKAGVGHGCTEAPRGILYHRYEIADDGSIVSARIAAPTSQNQLCIEEDLCEVANRSSELSDDALRIVASGEKEDGPRQDAAPSRDQDPTLPL